MNLPPHAPERRRNGGPTRPAAWRVKRDPPPERPLPEPRWVMAGFAVVVAVSGLVALGLWKLVEMIARAL